MPKILEKFLSPSVLAYDNCQVAKGIEKVSLSLAKWLHVDVMDGTFVENITFGQGMVAGIRKLTDLVLDVHLMVQSPLALIQSFAEAGSDIITFHCESSSDVAQTISHIKSCGCKAGVALKPDTSPKAIEKHLNLLDLVLVMSVEPGRCGQKFLDSAIKKISFFKDLRNKHGFDYKISVDGGINCDTLPKAATAGADVFVAGSAFYRDTENFCKLFSEIA